ncbi:hypothetical protein KMZ68_10510 [Bradyrhizobium sediminis]|uniref:Uncharacterized protein n=1 Tax=Bradyrhizobium sediminis TaxID=2840469 RepID=A0A975RU12_9BRAD|nr:hypothetical protein [Bradyrhizobium sediminis]QWG20220.1 hypothetical protein KMZ68_10510 [Bradyrhizobium sediminis]
MPSKSQLLWMYKVMKKARYCEDTIAVAHMEGKQPKFDIGAGPLPGEMHLAAGLESCAAGAFENAASQSVANRNIGPL